MSHSPPPSPVIEATGLVRTAGDRRLLDGIDLVVRPGEIVMLCGPSGSGKTTLLRALARLDPLQAGTIRVGGADEPLPAPLHRARIQYLPQRPVLFGERVADDLDAFSSFGAYRAHPPDLDRIPSLLERLGLDPSFLEARSDRLSGGERQIVALLRALILSPWLLLLDEPTAAVDAARRRAVEACIREGVASGSPRAALWATHDREQALRVGTRFLFLDRGRLVANGRDRDAFEAAWERLERTGRGRR